MVKAYLRYEHRRTLGVIVSPACNVLYDSSGKLAICAALENVSVWNLRLGVQVKELPGNGKALVTSLARSAMEDRLAIGYDDGSVALASVESDSAALRLDGHRSGITALHFHPQKMLLASGSKDSDIILWDVLAESGLYRLRGHKDQVTALQLLESTNHLISSSKDSHIRVWDLDTQHCSQIVTAHRAEVWSLAIDASEQILVSGGSDERILFVWRIDLEKRVQKKHAGSAVQDDGLGSADLLSSSGSVERAGRDRVCTLLFAPGGDMLVCHCADKSVELFDVLSDDLAMKKRKRKLQRKREKKRQKKDDGDEAAEADGDTPDDEVKAADMLRSKTVVRTATKISSVAIRNASAKKGGASDEKQLMCALTNNMLEVYAVRGVEYDVVRKLDAPGHRADIRALALSSDNAMLCSASSGLAKVWNVGSGNLTRTLPCGYTLCCAFLPGDRHVLLGTKSGMLELFDLSSSAMTASDKAHDGAVWALHVHPNQRSFVSAGADKQVLFWEFVVNNGVLGMSNTSSLTMTDDVLSVRFSSNGKFVAMALLDCTVKVFYADSMKFFLSLYGHRLPVLALDMSLDCTLLVTASADKNVKIWGLDFGDCHKSLFAHQDSVTSVSFMGKTHYFCSAGKDKLIKFWDADKFTCIMTLPGHHAEVWGLTVSSTGEIVVSAGHDRSIRVWGRTDQQLFIEEERENELEAMFENDIESKQRGAGYGEDGETALAGKATLDSLKAADRLIESIAMVTDELAQQHGAAEEHKFNVDAARVLKKKGPIHAAAVPPNPMMLGKPPSEFLLGELARIRADQLEQALVVVPFSTALLLMRFFNDWLNEGKSVELVAKCAIFIVQLHMNQLAATAAAADVLTDLSASLQSRLQQQKDLIGYNLAAMRHLQHEIEDAEGVSIVPQREQFEQRKSMGKPRKDTRDLRAKH